MYSISLLILILATVDHSIGGKDYDGWSLIKVQPKTQQQLDYLDTLSQNQPELEFQTWFRGSLQRAYDIFISPQSRQQFLNGLDNQGIGYEIATENIQTQILAEQIPVPTRNRALSFENSAWFAKFLNLAQINAAITQLATAHPDIVKIEKIGTSHEGRPINLVKVTSKTGSNKPGIWLDGGIHAREWASPATALYILNKLVTDNSLRKYIDGATWYIVVVANPDGYEYTQTEDRVWRKNRRPGRNGCDGVDLNRNFDSDFGGAGTSADPCDDTYHGTAAFSEPESKAIRDYILSHKDLKAYVSLHAIRKCGSTLMVTK